jgi:hypothetical protein
MQTSLKSACSPAGSLGISRPCSISPTPPKRQVAGTAGGSFHAHWLEKPSNDVKQAKFFENWSYDFFTNQGPYW